MNTFVRHPPRHTLEQGRDAEPCTLVIFGVSGDLSLRKLFPALYNLALDDQLPESFRIIGTGRSEMSSEALRSELKEAVQKHSRRAFKKDKWEALEQHVHYACTDKASGFGDLVALLDKVEAGDKAPGNRLFYLAVPPSAFVPIVQNIRKARLHKPGAGGSWCRLVVEKPIGRDFESASELNFELNKVFDESDIYRIDHYLGKETVQNLLVFRFANAIFEPLWNHKYIDHVQITVAESIGVEGRGRYFEEAGSTRDMIQNHLFQLLCLMAMEPPATLNADAIRDEKVKVLHSLRPIPETGVDQCAVRGQYGPGAIDGKAVQGYREEEHVDAESHTETFTALRLYVDNWRWSNTPFYLRTGKRLAKRATEISLHFTDLPHRLFQTESSKPSRNVLALSIQPEEGIRLFFDAKVPSAENKHRTVEMDFNYDESFVVEAPEAYERLLLDAISGDSTLFIRRDEVEASWRFIDPLLKAWRKQESPPPQYVSGSWGPAESDLLLAADRRRWWQP